jgi:hypothetical protein
MSHTLGSNRYPSNAAALPMPKAARAADEILTRHVRRQNAWRMFVAFTQSKARQGDHEAADLMAFVDAGGAA